MHPACVGLQFFERPRSALSIGRTRFRSPCIIMKRPRRFSLSTGSYLRIARSHSIGMQRLLRGVMVLQKWQTVRCCDLNNEYCVNVPLQVARPCGWLEGPLIVSRQLVALGTVSSLEKLDLSAQ